LAEWVTEKRLNYFPMILNFFMFDPIFPLTPILFCSKYTFKNTVKMN
jgi:hypothetical protein